MIHQLACHGSYATILPMIDGTLPSRESQRLQHAVLTYRGVGCTKGDTFPNGYDSIRRSPTIGSGEQRFEEASQTLLSWDMHRRAGLDVQSSSDCVELDAVAVLRLGWGPLNVTAPVRMVYLIDEPDRKSFAYGTLAGHPESGEESFTVELHGDDAVTFTIAAFSRPKSFLARVASPLTRAIQSGITNRYLLALATT